MSDDHGQEQEPVDPILDDTTATIEEPEPNPPIADSQPSPAIHPFAAKLPAVENDSTGCGKHSEAGCWSPSCDQLVRFLTAEPTQGKRTGGRRARFVTTDLDPTSLHSVGQRSAPASVENMRDGHRNGVSRRPRVAGQNRRI